MSLNFATLSYFQKAAELEHLTKAAGELYIAQPSLSRALHHMEDDLGVKLFARQGRSVKLTPYGEVVYDYTKVILSNLEEMKETLNQMQAARRRTVHLTYHAISQMIVSFIMEFRQEYPDLLVDMRQYGAEGYEKKGEDDLAAPEEDLILSTTDTPQEDEYTTVICKEPLVLALRSDDPNTRLPYATMRMLAGYRYITMPEGFMLRHIISDFFKKNNITQRVIASSDNPATAAEFIRAGLGAAIVPKYGWHMLSGRQIAFLPITEAGFYRYITIRRTAASLPAGSPAAVLYDYFLSNFAKFLHRSIQAKK